LTVADTGCGIAANVLPHIFDEFRRAPGTTIHGLGLGLTIVRRLVELHGGRVSARSDGPGRGALFVVDLPTAADPTAAAVRATPLAGGPS
jgi:two-component system CheB/CheR fusion protein